MEVDRNLYSRQIYTLGENAMKNIILSKVLISGLDGLGTEIAKNVCLIGVNQLSLHDVNNIKSSDLETGYYYNKNDIGKKRADILRSQISELNSNVKVVSHTENIDEDLIKQFTSVVLCNQSFDESIRVNNICRKHNIKFTLGRCGGVFGMVFNDFGEFTIHDTDGEDSQLFNISEIDNDGNVITLDNHNLQDNDIIKFTNVDGTNLDRLLEKTYKIKVITSSKFQIIDFDLINFKFKNSSAIKQKQSDVINFKSFEENIIDPNLVMDINNFEMPEKLFNMWKKYDNNVNYQPENELDRKFKCVSYQIQPVNSIIGAIISAECIKGVTNKYTPFNQIYQWSDTSVISDSYFDDIDPNYVSQTYMFGKNVNDKIKKLNMLMVGAGAIGCELLKNFAMMGVANEGNLYVTDMDTIEISNLNRQFLFRNSDVGKSKSDTAAKKIKYMNPNMNITPHFNKMCPDNEHIYDSTFFNNIDIVANALDNIQARLYVDDQCVKFKKPLMESGTLGVKGNTQIIVPNLTESYGSTRDPPEKTFAACTVKTFPNSIQHTIQYAREKFEDIFNDIPTTVMNYVNNKEYPSEIELNDKYQLAKNIKYLIKHKPENTKDCVKFGIYNFIQNFNKDIHTLVHHFPSDHKTSEGASFWSGGKKCPKVIVFDIDNQYHFDYVQVCAFLWAKVWNIDFNDNIKELLSNIDFNEFLFEDHKPIVNEEQLKDVEYKEEEPYDYEFIKDFTLFAQEFEKDDDSNGHIMFITSMSNMRALNYDINPEDFHKTKGIAGKIIPAMSTTTSLVAGLISLELYKLAMNKNKIEDYNNYFVNLALPLIISSDPIEAQKTKVGNLEFNMWENLEYNIDTTLNEFINYWSDKFSLNINMIACGSSIIYFECMTSSEIKEQKLSDIFKMKKKKDLYKDYVQVIISDDDETDIPLINVGNFVEVSLDNN
jgi:ubiquitin-activating enzyme E1